MPYDDCELTEGVTYEVLPDTEFTKQIPSYSQGFVRLRPYNQASAAETRQAAVPR